MLVDEHELLESRFYREFLKPQGIRRNVDCGASFGEQPMGSLPSVKAGHREFGSYGLLLNGSILIRAILVLALTSVPAVALELSLPIDCALGEDCFIQQYVDRDPGLGIKDYACGAQTYNGHKGTDFRIRNIMDVKRPVAVLAAAPGIIVGRRDGMRDHLIRSEEDRAAVADEECGNGVRIDHGGGWQTQYCHLRRGSVRVKVGQKVRTGTKLGEVGYSGDAAFPHVHLQVSKDRRVVDPFLPEVAASCGNGGKSLWSASTLRALTYRPATLLAVGVTDRAIALEELEEGTPLAVPGRESPAVAYMWAINLQKGDLIDLALTFRGRIVARNYERLVRNKAQLMLFAGKKAPPGGWPKGTYASQVEVIRNGNPVIKGGQTTVLE